MNYKERLYNYFSTCSGKISDVFYEVYDIIISLEETEQPLAVRFTCENIFNVRSDLSHEIKKRYYTLEQYRKAVDASKNKFRPILDLIIQDCLEKAVDEDIFYVRVWMIIRENSIFRSKRERAYALFTLADHPLVPYRNVGVGISMENEDFKQIIDGFKDALVPETKYILKAPYDQKTQRSSLLVDRLQELDSVEKQTVYLAVILEELEDKIKNQMKEAIEQL